jgi:dipeptidyl aminopeptidase/acylaminoacyl peptidase
MKIPTSLPAAAVLILITSFFCSFSHAQKPLLTIDEFFNSVDFDAVKLSPDGHSVVIGTTRADWDRSVFRHDLWLYRDAGNSLIQLTQSGRDTNPQWSPDGRWIAFLSERKGPSGEPAQSEETDTKEGGINQLYVISAAGGEAIPVTQSDEEIHEFGWAPDSRTVYFASRLPWNKQHKDAYKKEWKDVIQYRESERGDVIFSLDLAEAISRNLHAPAVAAADPENKLTDISPGARQLASTPWRVEQLVVSPDGKKLAFDTSSISQRQEKVDEFEIYVLDLAGSSSGDRVVRQLTKNSAVENDLYWSPDNRHIFFNVQLGDTSGPYRDLQPHLYWIDSVNGEIQQWSKDYIGSVSRYAVGGDRVLVAARQGTEVPLYFAATPTAVFSKLNSWPGTYDRLSVAQHSSRLAFVYSSVERPTEIFLAESANQLQNARPITAFNSLFTQRELPKGKPYRWLSDDGTSVEGMLIYPPGKFEQKNLPVFTLIHGGPADADGNHFQADWYQWDRLAATQGWLVFEPNYRGSTGYGDKFLLGIVPQIVSRPGKDILAGIDALVKDGIADPNRLTIGGYSYGGYMTNWLITQTTRFKAAVTGAGAVEHVANWGNDDTTFDDAYFLGGRPWEAQQRYHDEAAIFQIDKVKTPTHMVAGAADIRVAVLENYLLEHALRSLGVPSSLLVFPGEGHSLSKNPWHGKIKVREELKWLEKYGGIKQ